MGHFLDSLKAAKSLPVAIRQRFRIEFRTTGGDAYAFFESTDDGVFYRRPIAERLRQGSRLWVYYCGNKRSVWEHYEFAEREGKLRNALFFVDKDLDDYTGAALPPRGNIFVTDYYSVENYLCSEETLAAALEHLLFLPKDDQRYAEISKQFRAGFDELAGHLRPLFAEVILLRQQLIKVSFSDFGASLSPCFRMVDLRPAPLPNLESTFRKRCRYDNSVLKASEIRAVTDALSELPHNHWLRGKFALWFFLQFVGMLWASLVGTPINDRKKIKRTVDLNPENAFLFLEGKHPLPPALDRFLETNILKASTASATATVTRADR